MAAKRKDMPLPILPHGLRDQFRDRQIAAIKGEVTKKYAERIKAARGTDAKRALKAERDAEIARLIEPLLREREKDTPWCL